MRYMVEHGKKREKLSRRAERVLGEIENGGILSRPGKEARKYREEMDGVIAALDEGKLTALLMREGMKSVVKSLKETGDRYGYDVALKAMERKARRARGENIALGYLALRLFQDSPREKRIGIRNAAGSNATHAALRRGAESARVAVQSVGHIDDRFAELQDRQPTSMWLMRTRHYMDNSWVQEDLDVVRKDLLKRLKDENMSMEEAVKLYALLLIGWSELASSIRAGPLKLEIRKMKDLSDATYVGRRVLRMYALSLGKEGLGKCGLYEEIDFIANEPASEREYYMGNGDRWDHIYTMLQVHDLRIEKEMELPPYPPSLYDSIQISSSMGRAESARSTPA